MIDRAATYSCTQLTESCMPFTGPFIHVQYALTPVYIESATSSHRVSAILCVNSNSRRAKWNGIYFLIDESRDRESLV